MCAKSLDTGIVRREALFTAIYHEFDERIKFGIVFNYNSASLKELVELLLAHI